MIRISDISMPLHYTDEALLADLESSGNSCRSPRPPAAPASRCPTSGNNRTWNFAHRCCRVPLSRSVQRAYKPCYLIALVTSVVWNFTLNRKFTFKSANNVPKAMALVLCYYAVFTPLSTLLGNWLALLLRHG